MDDDHFTDEDELKLTELLREAIDVHAEDNLIPIAMVARAFANILGGVLAPMPLTDGALIMSEMVDVVFDHLHGEHAEADWAN